MPVFVVILNRSPEPAVARIRALPENNAYKIKQDVWLVDYNGTTKALAEKLGIRGTDSGGSTGIVFPITNYAGRASSDVWEWLKLHMSEHGD